MEMARAVEVVILPLAGARCLFIEEIVDLILLRVRDGVTNLAPVAYITVQIGAFALRELEPGVAACIPLVDCLLEQLAGRVGASVQEVGIPLGG